MKINQAKLVKVDTKWLEYHTLVLDTDWWDIVAKIRSHVVVDSISILVVVIIQC